MSLWDKQDRGHAGETVDLQGEEYLEKPVNPPVDSGGPPVDPTMGVVRRCRPGMHRNQTHSWVGEGPAHKWRSVLRVPVVGE